jgi:type I restriction enzyme S subunit
LLYKEWFVHLRFPGHEHTRIIDGVPEGWKKKRLGDVVATNAESYKANNLPTEINYIDISSVKQSRILSKNKMLSSEAPGRARRIGADGDIIWSNVRPNLRAYALVLEPDDNDVFSTGFTILSPVAIPFSYLYLFATTDEFVGHLVNHTTGASYPAVRPADFERAEILLPAQSVLSIFHEKLEPALRMIQVLQKEINALARARDLLLPKLMNGEVTV